MTGFLFPAANLGPASPAPYRLVGPYGRMSTESYLKFWFVRLDQVHSSKDRYLVLFGTQPHLRTGRSQRMGSGLAAGATHKKFAIPADLSRYPSIAYPRFKNDRLERAMESMLTGLDVADVTRVRLLGLLPDPPRDYAPCGEQLCQLPHHSP